MRFLIAIRPFYGHLHPVVPIARALSVRGHEVVFATERSFCRVVERCGFASLPAGLDPFAPAPYQGYELSESVTRRKVEDILAVSTAWPIDVILRDPTDFAAVVAAEALGTPHATIGFARFCANWWWERVLGSSLDAVRASLGVPADPRFERLYPTLYIDTVPSWLQVEKELPVEVLFRVRPEPYQSPRPRAGPGLAQIPPGPVVLVTLGTVFHRRPGLLEFLCRGARRAGASVVCTLGPHQDPDSSALAGLPGVYLTDYVPLADILPRCSAVVTHGGYNTVVAAVLRGVPLVVVPLGADNAHNAQRCAEAGVALTESPSMITEPRAAELVAAVLAEPEFRCAARRLAASSAGMPPAGAAVSTLERLTAPAVPPPNASTRPVPTPT